MAVYTSPMIGHASIDERGKANGGAAGDQTGKEVCVRTWYASGWNVVLRPKSKTVAETMASACEILCNGNLVGYDQYQRNTLWDELAKVNWNPSALKVKTETDCSAFMTACAKIAGIEVPRVALGNGQYNAPVTQTMRSAFSSTGSFEVLTESKYMTSANYLRRGDILVRESGHTAMALTNGSLSGAEQSTSAQDTIVNYQGKVTASSLNCRIEPNGAIITAYPNGTILTITKERNGWGYTGTGWVSLDYIQKIIKEDDMFTYEKWKEYMVQYRKEHQDNDRSEWSKEASEFCIANGLFNGSGNDANGNPNYMYEDFLTREQAMQLLFNFAKWLGKA